MKRTRKGLLLGLVMLVAAVCMLFAACGSNKIKLSFDTAGGPAVESVELNAGEAYTLPTPVWEGHSFEGWYADSAYTGSPVTAVTAEKNTTYYAKWEQMYAITLELSGGSLGGTTTLYVKEGTNVSAFMKDYVPTLQDHEFGEWLVGGTPLSAGYVLTKDGITLTAHYKVAYTVELYLQKLENGSEYERAENDYVGYEYAGAEFAPAPEVQGFSVAPHEGSVSSKVLSENASENKFTLYMNRQEFTLVLESNYPAEAGLEAERVVTGNLYGAEFELPVPFTAEGYCLVGWSPDSTGEVKYRSAYMDSVLRNATVGSDPYKTEAHGVLYAVWEKGYSDMFGGDDYIFHFAEDAEEIYLLRGGVMFAGTYSTRTEIFRFITGSGDNETIILQGKLNADGTFSYLDEDRAGFTYYYFKNGVGRDNRYRIKLDGYNGITYIDTDGTLDKESKGSYTIGEDGLYNVTYTEGPLQGQSFVYALSSGGRNGAIFMVRDEEEFGWGAIPRGTVNTTEGSRSEGTLTYYTSAYSLTLNGFGNAVYAAPSGNQSYYYLREDDVITVMNSMGVAQFEARLPTIQGRRAYLLDVTYENGAEKLKLDGMYQATYTDANGAATEGTYTLYSSMFGTLVQFFYQVSDATRTTIESRLFLARTETETVIGEDGESQRVYHYYFDEEPLSYTEYRYLEGGSILSTLITVVNDKEEGKATVYGYSATGYVPVLYGNVTEGTEEGLYVFTVTDVNEDAVLVSQPFDVASVKAFVFSTDLVISSSGSAYSVVYWYSMTTEAGTDKYDVRYTAADGSTLVTVRGFGVYTPADGEPITGVLTTSNGITSLYNAVAQEAYYFELHDDETTPTFTLLTGFVGSLNVLLANGNVSSNERLTFNGKGGAVYAVTTTGDEGSTTVEHEGTYTDTGKPTEFGLTVYQFTATDGTSFRFAIVSADGSTAYFAKFNEETNGTYTSDAGTLILDGFSFLASYTDAAGTALSGIYAVSGENVIQMIASDNRLYYFDLKSGNSFTVRDEVYGSYFYVNNRSIGELAFHFDGYGHLSGMSSSEDVTLFENGTYEKLEDGNYRLTYTLDGQPHSLVGWVGTITISSTEYNAFYALYDEIVMSYVNEEDWSVLVLDNRGNATKYNEDGTIETGNYTLVTDTMLYYVNSAGSDACIYLYDRQKRTANPIKFTERAYYTEDFAALLFTSYGFMIMDGETRYYYNVDEDGDVLLYLRDDDDPAANKYGFVEKDFFGRFTDEKEIEGKKYYRSSSMKLLFTRKEESKAKYPVPTTDNQMLSLGQLEFSPTGSAEFTDSDASIWLGEQKVDCTVSRVLLEDGTYQMYVGIQNFVFEIDVTFRGDYEDEASEYEVTAMRTERTFYSYTYLYYLLNYLMQGYVIPNTFGVITLVTEFDDTGTAGTPQATGVFGLDSGFVDSKGELISFENVGYTTEGGVYSVSCTGSDGFTYNLHFSPDNTFYSYLGLFGYRVDAFTRTETLEADGYTVTAERVLSTERINLSAGGYWTFALSKDGQEIAYDEVYIYNGTVYYFERTREEETDKILTTKLYSIVFAQRTPEDADDTVGELEPFVSVTVTLRELKVAYTQDGQGYVEYDDKGIVLYYNGSGTYLFEEKDCQYDAATGAYTLTAGSRVFTVTIDSETNVATVIESAAPSQSESGDGEETEQAD